MGLLEEMVLGKLTLLKILLNKLSPYEGKVKLGTKMEIAYFDQLREHLDMEKNLVDNVSDGGDSIEINGKSKHVISYLSEFLLHQIEFERLQKLYLVVSKIELYSPKSIQ